MRLKTGERLGNFEVIRLLGAGGMGEVYLGEDKRLGRKVALKILPSHLAQNADKMHRFGQEARATSALNHPNILTVYDIGAENDTHFIAAEFVTGETLRQWFRAAKPELIEILDISVQIASALCAAHEARIIHRDIKPENIMLREDRLVKVLDFGLAKLAENKPEAVIDTKTPTIPQIQTNPGIVMGTVAYMSPEQARGQTVDARTDVWSLGVVLYEMLTRRLPFEGETVGDCLASILKTEPLPLSSLNPQIPAELERIINKTLVKDREERYQTAKDLLIDLRQLKKRLEFSAELERSAPPEKSSAIDKTHSSIAVLPFVNLSNDAENEYFCDGLAEELLNALTKIESLKVAARTSAFSFKGRNASVGEISKILNVKTVLEGSVRKSGNRLRIAVQLVDAASGYHLWSERYDRELQDIFDVQDEIALAVVDALKLKLFGDEKAQVLKRYTDNAEGYELYLKGRFFLNQARSEAIKKAIEFFTAAIEIDSNNALAYAGLADCYNRLPISSDVPPLEAFPKARDAALKALEIDDRLAEAHSALGWIHFWFDWDWDACEKEYRRAIELDPNYPEAHLMSAHFLSNLGRHKEALAAFNQAQKLDPLSLIIGVLKGQALMYANRHSEAVETLHKTLEIAPNFWLGQIILAKCYERTRQYDEALTALQIAAQFSGGTSEVYSLMGYIYAVSDRRAEAERVLSKLNETSKQKYVPPYNLALIHNGLGNFDEALVLLEKGYKEKNALMVFLGVDEKWDNLRPDARFQNILRRVNLATDDKPTDETSEARTIKLSPANTAKKIKAATSDNANSANGKKPVINFNSLITLLSLLVLAGLLAAWSYFNQSPKEIDSIAVMPFVNESGNADNEYLSDGMTETLIGSLSQLPRLNVKARSSVFRYKGKETNAQTVGKELSVQAILLGRVIQRGEQLTLYLELVNTQTGNRIWGEQYNRRQVDLVMLQTEIARDVSNKLQLKLSGAEERKLAQKLTKNYTENAEAYQLYLKGRYHVLKLTPQDFQKSILYFQQAIETDPNYALAYVGLADAYRSFGLAGEQPPNEVSPKAKAAAQKAIDIDETLAEAHAVLGFIIFWYDWDWATGERHLKRALELNPNKADAHFAYGHFLSTLGRHEAGLAELKRARELEPLDLRISTVEATFLTSAGRNDEALDKLQKIFEIDPNYWFAHRQAASTYIKKGMYSEAIVSARKAVEFNNRNSQSIAQEGYALAKLGKRVEAKAKLEELFKLSNERYIPPICMAIVYIGLDEKDNAIAWLERAYNEKDPRIVFLKTDSYWNELRNEPRFQEIMRRLNFPQ